MTQLEKLTGYYHNLGHEKVMVMLYLTWKYNDVYLSDLAAILGVTTNLLTPLINRMEKFGIAKREFVTRAGGRAGKLIIEPDTFNDIRDNLKLLEGSTEVEAAVLKYEQMKAEGSLIAVKYNL